MNRQIKFRAWDGESMIQLPLAGLQYFDFEGSYALSFVVDGYKGFWAHEQYESASKKAASFPIMQFTGLKDKNGVDIYEHDILTIQREFDFMNVVCKFGTVQRQMATGWLVDITGFYFERPDGLNSFPIVKNHAGVHDLTMIEVIGNIYQHPELLTP